MTMGSSSLTSKSHPTTSARYVPTRLPISTTDPGVGAPDQDDRRLAGAMQNQQIAEVGVGRHHNPVLGLGPLQDDGVVSTSKAEGVGVDGVVTYCGQPVSDQ